MKSREARVKDFYIISRKTQGKNHSVLSLRTQYNG